MLPKGLLALEFLENVIQKIKARIKSDLFIVKEALAKETDETKEMIITYMKFSQGKASKKEMKLANKQFQSFLKTIGLGTLAVLPLAPFTIPLIVKLGRHFGIDIIPNSFKRPSKEL